MGALDHIGRGLMPPVYIDAVGTAFLYKSRVTSGIRIAREDRDGGDIAYAVAAWGTVDAELV